ncbi:MAG TPA: hypothetical protein VFK06_17665 [Candidatus Angelobacter sp.]|nr:hypothetical protein [Candidatus Angelobacter sp.]
MKTTLNNTTTTKTFTLENRVLQLDVDRTGKITRRTRELRNVEGRLENTLLSALYPSVRVATVNIPKQMETHEEVRVHETLADFEYQGLRYTLVGASGSAKEGKFYFVEKEFSRILAQRFQNWPEMAMVYFGILVSPCPAMIAEPDVRVLVVPDRTLGTNDCRGWITRSLFSKLKVREGLLYQFRIAFENTQGKGCFKVMEDAVAEALDADVILPESAIKPSLKLDDGDSQALRTMKRIVPSVRSIFTPWAKSGAAQAAGLAGRRVRSEESFSICGPDRRFRGQVVLGVREVSRELEFKSSYQLTQFAPAESIETEILPESLDAINKLSNAISEGDYSELMELLGGSPESASPAGMEQEADEDHELDTVRALLIADGSADGVMIRYPYIRKRLNELLAKWAFKLTTGGGFRLPAYMLADDGYLFVANGTVYSGADWIPTTSAIMAGDSERSLVVRYPIRMFEDLLPVSNLSDAQLRQLLAQRFRKQQCNLTEAALDELIRTQLRLDGALILHSEKATENGGDFDGDWCGLLHGNRFPILVNSRFNHSKPFRQTKTKHERKKSSPLNAEAVALAAVGNQIGPITVLMTRCIAAGRPDLAYQLVEQLQNALDSLKHSVKPDLELVRDIRKQVKDYAPWLAFKNARKVSELPDYLEVADTDRIGQLYNLLRSHIGEFFTGHSKIKDFKGLVLGSSPTREMIEECSRINGLYAAVVASISKRTQPVFEQLRVAEENLKAALAAAEEKPTPENKALVRRARQTRNSIDADVTAHQERTKEEIGKAIAWIRLWASAKTENREAWCQALHRIVCQGEGNGSILVFAFPQELVNKIAERTGGKALSVILPKVCDGFVHVDEEGRSFLVEPIRTGGNHPGLKLSYLFTFRNGRYSTEDIPDQNLTSEQAAQLTAEIAPATIETAHQKEGREEATALHQPTETAPEAEDPSFDPEIWATQTAGVEEFTQEPVESDND